MRDKNICSEKGGEIMNIALWVVFGALAGWLASIILDAKTRQDIVINVILGIIGAFLGGFIMNLFGLAGITRFDIYSLLVAVLGAVIVVWGVSVFRKTA